MKKNGQLYYIILTLLGGAMMLMSYPKEDKKLWGKIDAPDSKYQIMLYQKDRNMHQAPEILVYYQNRNSTVIQPVGNILLPEDDRNQLTYDYEWSSKKGLTLMVNCDKCMIEQRRYTIQINKNQAILTQIIDDTKRNV